MEKVISKNNIPIRLTEERWLHIVENHDEMAGYYDKELSENDGFIITAYFTSKVKLSKEEIVWQRK